MEFVFHETCIRQKPKRNTNIRKTTRLFTLQQSTWSCFCSSASKWLFTVGVKQPLVDCKRLDFLCTPPKTIPTSLPARAFDYRLQCYSMFVLMLSSVQFITTCEFPFGSHTHSLTNIIIHLGHSQWRINWLYSVMMFPLCPAAVQIHLFWAAVMA